MKNYTVYYSGGSGGHMFFWSLQLALGYDVHSQIEKNWDIQSIATWKDSEVIERAFDARSNGVRLICNSDQLYNSNKVPDINIMCITDVNTQVELARAKGAHWFRKNKNKLLHMNRAYPTVKDGPWPDCRTLEDYNNLPIDIKHELANYFHFPIDGYEELGDSNIDTVEKEKYFELDDIKIHIDNKYLIGKVDHVFLLQDIVNTKFKCATDALGLEHTQEVADHVDKWVNLHPQHLQDMLHNNTI